MDKFVFHTEKNLSKVNSSVNNNSNIQKFKFTKQFFEPILATEYQIDLSGAKGPSGQEYVPPTSVFKEGLVIPAAAANSLHCRGLVSPKGMTFQGQFTSND